MRIDNHYWETRARFDHPVTCTTPAPAWAYCVGGAFCMAQDGVASPLDEPLTKRFPGLHTLATYLTAANIRLPFDIATRKASDIIAYNDEGLFDAAWETLYSALSFGNTNEDQSK